MEDSGAILNEICSLKGMLDHVNEEIEENIQITREIESEIVKCSEIECSLAARESELTKMLYMLQFELIGLSTVVVDARASEKLLAEELCCLQMRRDEICKTMNDQRDGFTTTCLEFQKEIGKGDTDELGALLLEKEFLQNDVHILHKKCDAMKNSMSAFVDEILQDLHHNNSALHVEITSGKQGNDKLLKDIDNLKTTLLSTMGINNSQQIQREIIAQSTQTCINTHDGDFICEGGKHRIKIIIIDLGSSRGLLIFIIVVCCLYKVSKRRQKIKLKLSNNI